jgi:hypothetical protein
MHATGETVCWLRGLLRGVKKKSTGATSHFSSAREIEKRGHYGSVDNSVVGYSPDRNNVSTEAEESPSLRAVTKQRLLNTLQAGEDLACSDL